MQRAHFKKICYAYENQKSSVKTVVENEEKSLFLIKKSNLN